MVKKIIQVPVEDGLLKALDKASKKQLKPRAALIRQACSNYLQQLEKKELDQLYEQGYRKFPEEAATGEVQAALTGQVLSRESW